LAYIKQLEEVMYGDTMLCHLATAESAHPKVKALAERLRGEDHFFSSNDQIIRDCFARFFPGYQDYVTCIRYQEIEKMPSLEECKKRFVNYVLDSNGYSAAEPLSSYQKRNSFTFEEPERLEVKGRTAYPGKASGKVKIVRLLKDLTLVQKGDILVTPMTTPAYTLSLHKVAGIITDEGGILCHAAIIARELKIPCVIGTKNATKLLKDGDLVEANAENGIVRKIK